MASHPPPPLTTTTTSTAAAAATATTTTTTTTTPTAMHADHPPNHRHTPLYVNLQAKHVASISHRWNIRMGHTSEGSEYWLHVFLKANEGAFIAL